MAGCGAASAPPLALRCTTQRLTAGYVRALVTVSNETEKVQRAFVFGPNFAVLLVHQSPVLGPAPVSAMVSRTQRNFVGLLIPAIAAHAKRRLFLRFAPFPRPHAIVVSDRASIQASDWHVLDNPHCTIRA